MEYSKENVMTRKEYLKSKKKKNKWLSFLKHFLIIAVIILLSIYLYKQLDVYNNVTKIANKVVEETALAKTMTMYYVQKPYIKDGNTNVVLYKSFDESRTVIKGTEGLNNICIKDNILYGMKDNNIYSINLETGEEKLIVEEKVTNYVVNNKTLYYYLEVKKDKEKTGIYKIDKEGTPKLVINEEIFDMCVTDKNIYIIAKGKTSRSIIRYDTSGNNKKEISEKYIVNEIKYINSNVYFTTTKDYSLYVIDKNEKIQKITENKVKAIKNLIVYENNIFYINDSDNSTIYKINEEKEEMVLKKSVESIQVDGNIIYYKIKDAIGIFKYDILTGNTAQITSARTSEYICKN